MLKISSRKFAYWFLPKNTTRWRFASKNARLIYVLNLHQRLWDQQEPQYNLHIISQWTHNQDLSYIRRPCGVKEFVLKS